MASNKSIYYRLDTTRKQIRIVNLEPGSGSDLIKCSLETVEWKADLVYEALSYEWGCPEFQKQVSLEGQIFSIRHNLWSALCRLRLNSEKRTLWIDALCINQEDISERNHQVGLIKHIYRGAKLVHVWLGEEDQDTSMAFAVLRDIEENGKADLFAKSLFMDYLNRKDFEAHVSGGDHLRAFMDLLRRPYWERVWIIQEFVLAQDTIIYCGSYFGRLPQYGMALIQDMFSRTPGAKIIRRYHRYQELRRSLIASDEVVPLGSALLEFRKSKSQDPRDKVYALLGLATDIPENSIVVDYDKPVVEVRKDVLRAYAQFYFKSNSARRGWVSFQIYTVQKWMQREGHERLELETLIRSYLSEFGVEYPFLDE